MNAKDDALMAVVDRLNALLGWWAVPIASGTMDSQIRRFHQFASDIQKICADAYSGQMGALFSNNDRLVRSFQDLLRCRRPQEVLTANQRSWRPFSRARHCMRSAGSS